jgi:tetratricopeptide (TPR) repeat protein
MLRTTNFRDKRFRIMRLCFVAMALCATLGCTTQHESLLRQADATADPAAALKTYVAALQAVPAGDETGADFEIRKKAIACARKMTPPPAVPADAQQHFVQAAVILNDSKDELARQRAAAEFVACLRTAPWHADAYYNLAALQEVAKDNEAALANYQLYLLANPGADNAKAVQAKVAALELRRKKSGPAALEGIWRNTDAAAFGTWRKLDPYTAHYVFRAQGARIYSTLVYDRDDPSMGIVKGETRPSVTYEMTGRRIKGVGRYAYISGIVSEDFNRIDMTDHHAGGDDVPYVFARFKE